MLTQEQDETARGTEGLRDAGLPLSTSDDGPLVEEDRALAERGRQRTEEEVGPSGKPGVLMRIGQEDQACPRCR